jgi:phage shock protein E
MSKARKALTVGVPVMFAVTAALGISTKPWVSAQVSARVSVAPTTTIPNELIDYRGFKNIVAKAQVERETKRLSEADFLAAMKEPGTVLLDARSSYWFDQRHLRGAVSLPFTDWTNATLTKVIPTKNTKILIYCNNNFLGSQLSFATKAAPASLNLSSYTSLMAYGYTNIYELGPVLQVDDTLLPFEGREINVVRRANSAQQANVEAIRSEGKHENKR